jgi:hypothetical protein
VGEIGGKVMFCSKCEKEITIFDAVCPDCIEKLEAKDELIKEFINYFEGALHPRGTTRDLYVKACEIAGKQPERWGIK